MLFLFKTLKCLKTNQLLSLKAIISRGAIDVGHSSELQRLFLEVIDNSSLEIKNGVLEFERILLAGGSFKGNTDLQKKFWTCLSEWSEYSDWHKVIRCGISDTFLESNKKYLFE